MWNPVAWPWYDRVSHLIANKGGRTQDCRFRKYGRGSRLVPVILVALLVTLFSSLGRSIATTVSLLHRRSPSLQPLTVLISSSDVDVGEVDYWIHGILSRLGRPIDVQVVPTQNLRLVDDSIVVAFNDLQRWTDLKRKSLFRNVGLVRIGDEYGNDTNYNDYSYVLRPYWFDHIFRTTETNTPVIWIPNGYSTGVGPRPPSTLLSYSRRPDLCYFEGSPRDNGQPSSRMKMHLELMRWDPHGQICKVRWTDGFMKGQSPLGYSASLGRAKYALCPAGNNAETIRFYEALENNAIPIVVYERWMTAVFGAKSQFPFIVLNTWDELGPRLKALAAEPFQVGVARQKASRQWWEQTQATVRKAAMHVVDQSFDNKR